MNNTFMLGRSGARRLANSGPLSCGMMTSVRSKSMVPWCSALRKASGDIEDAHGVAVEVVTVGDAPLDDRLAALLRAAREAMVNAAKHAQVDKVDVYAEVDADQVALFVRDRGVGFDPETIPADRLGVRGSIQDRMRRHGGTAIVRSVPGEGTEVRLVMKRSNGPAAPATEEDVTS